MKIIFFILGLFICQIANSQVVTTLDIADITGADTTIWLTKDQSKYSYSLGVLADFRDITGTTGTFSFLNSPVDTIDLIMPSGTFIITTDTQKALISDVVPFEFIGFKMTKGTLTGGIITYYFSRKTRK